MKKYLHLISMNPEIRFGKPCIKGTRITVSDILDRLASGMTYQEIIEDYPLLNIEHIYAALTYAAKREAFTQIISRNDEIIA